MHGFEILLDTRISQKNNKEREFGIFGIERSKIPHEKKTPYQNPRGTAVAERTSKLFPKLSTW